MTERTRPWPDEGLADVAVPMTHTSDNAQALSRLFGKLAVDALVRWLESHIAFALIAVYAVSVLWLAALGRGIFAPMFLADETEYALTGQNLAMHFDFAFRGAFPVLVQPGYPVLVAVARLLAGGSTSTDSIFVLNHLFMASTIFPAFLLARLLNISRLNSLQLGLAAIWVPNMIYATHYMTETIYYPLFVLTCYLVARYFLNPSRAGAIWVGIAMSAALLTKSTALAIVAGWIAGNGWQPMIIWLKDRGRTTISRQDARAWLLWPALALGIVLLTYVCWLIFKATHVADNLTNLLGDAQSSKPPVSPPKLAQVWSIYAADILLSVGAVSVLPIAIAMRSMFTSAGEKRNLVVFWLMLFAAVTTLSSVVSGAQGEVRDRHLFVLIPILLVMACRGLTDLASVRWWRIFLLSTVSSAPVLAIFHQYSFSSTPMSNAPWLYAMSRLPSSAFTWTFHQDSFWRDLIVITLLSQGLWIVRPNARVAVFLAVTLAVFAWQFTITVGSFQQINAVLQASTTTSPSSLTRMLATTVGPQGRLMVLGWPGTSGQPLPDEVDARLRPWVEVELPANQNLLFAEAAGLYDVRYVPHLSMLNQAARLYRSKYLLSPVDLIGLHRVKRLSTWRLYLIQSRPATYSPIAPGACGRPQHGSGRVGGLGPVASSSAGNPSRRPYALCDLYLPRTIAFLELRGQLTLQRGFH